MYAFLTSTRKGSTARYTMEVRTSSDLSQGETLHTFYVQTKAEARRLCASMQTKPWNF